MSLPPYHEVIYSIQLNVTAQPNKSASRPSEGNLVSFHVDFEDNVCMIWSNVGSTADAS
jgi:hypothetical protein